VYGTLRQLIGGAWQVARYTFTESGSTTAATLTPTTGTLLTSQQFTWNNGSGVTDFQVLLGTTAEGSSDIYNSGITTNTSATVSIPPYGDTVYGTLRQLIGGTWQVTRYTFTEPGATTLATLTPSSGPLSASQQFTWNNGTGETDYQVLIGTTGPGSSDIYNSGITTNTSATVSIPPYGDTVYGTLRQLVSGTWQVTRYTFTEPGATTPATLSPSSGPLSASQQFTWNNGTGETDYQVLIGTTGPGSSDIYNSGITTNTSALVSVPSYGDTVYGTLRQLIGGTWQVTRYTFTEPGATIPATLTPSSGTLLSSQLFTWNNGTGATEYQVFLGTAGSDSSNLYNSGITTSTSTTISIPSNGVTVYGTLRQLIGGAWQVTRYTFTEPAPPAD
jgi:DNA-binding transcriptional regulator of glucitol operon